MEYGHARSCAVATPVASPVETRWDGGRLLFDASPSPLLVYDLQTLAVLDVNMVACRKYGYTRAEFLGLTLHALHPAEDVQALEAFIKAAPPGRRLSGVWRHRLRDGSLINVESTSHEILFDGRRARLAGPIDVTARVRVEQALRERESALRRAQRLAKLAHVVSGADGEFESWSDSLPGLLGVKPSGVPRSVVEWLALVHEDDRALVRRRAIEAAQTGSHVEIEYRMLRPKAETMHLRQVIEPMLSPGGARFTRWFSTVQDVTAQKVAEAAVRHANELLEQRVRERTLQLESSNRELAHAIGVAERANRAKSEFLSNMSHELRTPLNAIVGFGQLLAMPEIAARDGAQRAGFVEHIVDAGRHLLTLIDEILNLAQIEAGKVEVRIEPVRVIDLLAECDAMVDPLAAQRNVTMQFPVRCELMLQADRMRLKQVLLNLISNAIKYNRENGSVTVDCERIGDHVRVNVRDTGLGMTEAQLSGLFQAFNRLGQENGAAEGSGIGLVVTQQLVELMGGDIGVSSTAGVGSVFFVEFPVAVPAAPPARPRFDANDAAWRVPPMPSLDESDREAGDDGSFICTVLCVDDDPASLRLAQQVLSTLPSVQLLTASNGRLGVEMALAHAPAVIVMDNNMPEMSGREALARLHVDLRTATIPVIALSADAMPGVVDEGLAAGFFRYLTKPFDVRELLRAVTEAMRVSAAPGGPK